MNAQTIIPYTDMDAFPPVQSNRTEPWVFCPNTSLRYNPVSGRRESTLSQDKLRTIGPVRLISHGRHSFEDNALTEAVEHACLEFNPEIDFVLCAGDMAVLGFFLARLSAHVDGAQVLRWDRKLNGYAVIDMVLAADDNDDYKEPSATEEAYDTFSGAMEKAGAA